MRAFTCGLLTLFVLGLAAACSSGSGSAPAHSKPNIVVIVTDDADTASFAYTPKTKAALLDQGTFFPNFFITLSLCCPSRVTFLRGQYAHNHRVLTSGPPDGGFTAFQQHQLDDSTVATWLQDAGYRTALIGKYLNGYPKDSNRSYIPPGWSEWYAAVGDHAYSQFNYTLNENGILNAYGKAPADYGTDVLSRKAAGFIRRASRANTPFFLYLTPLAPHWPAAPAPRYAHLFPGAKAPRTPAFDEEDVSDKPDYIQALPRIRPPLDELYRKRLQSMQAVDDMVANVVRELGRQGKLDNTYIFFTTDNGFMLGQHRIGGGKRVPYEESTRAAMIVRGPGVPKGATLHHLTANTDIAPTLADLTGVDTPSFVDGRSLVPLLESEPPPLAEWRHALLLEYWPGRVDQRSLLQVPRFSGVRTQHLAYIEYATGERELYDLRTDPDQLDNIAASAGKGTLSQLSQLVAALKICQDDDCQDAEDTAVPADVQGVLGLTKRPRDYSSNRRVIALTPHSSP
ncbi:MAG: sulfatase [Dehalococcoidia bacterium]